MEWEDSGFKVNLWGGGWGGVREVKRNSQREVVGRWEVVVISARVEVFRMWVRDFREKGFRTVNL